MKVFIYIGSLRGSNSYGYEFMLNVKERIKNKDIQMEICTANDFSINYCQGCANCFKGIRCPQDDDMEAFKEKMCAADVIIFVSPVYVHSVSASIKTVIDRLGYITHFMPLLGKKGYVISVASDNGNNYVNEYLMKMYDYWGITCVKTLSIQSAVMDADVIGSYAGFLANELERLYRNPMVKATAAQERYFNFFSDKYAVTETNTPDATRWREQNYFDAHDANEMIQTRVCNSNFTYEF